MIVLQGGEICFFGVRIYVFLKAGSGKRLAPHNFVLLNSLRVTRVIFVMYIALYHFQVLCVEKYCANTVCAVFSFLGDTIPWMSLIG